LVVGDIVIGRLLSQHASLRYTSLLHMEPKFHLGYFCVSVNAALSFFGVVTIGNAVHAIVNRVLL